MALACQQDSYLKQCQAEVKSCQPAQLKRLVNGKKETVKGFEVVLNDTVLFPEGGGQPFDTGTIGDAEVLQVIRQGADAVHFLREPLDVGCCVSVQVNWARRWDHMQQHSGQHLITAVADSHFGYPTTSWNLGDRISSIELDTLTVTAEELSQIEAMTNEKIREAVRMYPTLYSSKDDPALLSVRTRGLPDDHVGPVRVVTIEGVENNMCCGTHVSSTAHLQVVKVLGVEKGKKGKVNLLFVAGDRVSQYLSRCYENEKMFTSYLKGGPDDHVELLDKLQKSCKVAQKNATVLLREVAMLEAKLYKATDDHSPLFSLHKREGDNEFMNTLVNELGDAVKLVFITTGDDKGQGLFMLSGDEATVGELGPQVAEILVGKGAGKRGRFQGKATKLQRRAAAEELLQKHLAPEP